jgi:hypothetical protein
VQAWIEADAAEIGVRIEDLVQSPQLPWPDRAEQGGIFAPPAGMDEIPVSR